MLKKRKLAAWGAVVCLLMLTMSSVTVFAAEEAAEYVPKMYASFWALVPPVVAIVLALITKEVYISLLIGILAGALFFTGFNPVTAVETAFGIMGNKIGDNLFVLIL